MRLNPKFGGVLIYQKLTLPKLPHFSRKFTARLFLPFFRYSLLVLLIIILVTNLINDWIADHDYERKLRLRILTEPEKSNLHEELASFYLKINAGAAEQEYRLADELYLPRLAPPGNVAGSASSPWQTWLSIKTQQEKLREELKIWEMIHKIMPDYQYATLKLAILNYQLGDREKSSQYSQALYWENPSEESVGNILEKIKNK